jgi:His Kinase A (phospho-acceptor) domain
MVVSDVAPGRLYLARTPVDGLAHAEGSRDEFLAAVCHELRCPLAAIQNASRLLSSDAETAARLKAQVLMERQIRRMTQLLEDLQDLSRSSHGGLPLRRERLDLRLAVGMHRDARFGYQRARSPADRGVAGCALMSLRRSVAPGAGVREPAVQCLQIYGCWW